MSQTQSPKPVLPALRSWPLHTADESRAIEQAAAATLPPHTLMARAGDGVARLALAVSPHARTVDVWCGPGNNGGDGFVAARLLQSCGKSVRAVVVGNPARRPADAAHAFEQARDAGVALSEAMPVGAPADLAIDALLGIGGGRRAAEGIFAAAIERLDGSRSPVLAVDLPSGLDGDTGRVPGIAVRATHTLSLLTLKPGLFTAQGRDHAGRVWFDDLAAAAGGATLELAGPEAARALSAPRRHAQHKGSFGDLMVVGGAAGMVGAAVLAARAALAAGAGRIYLGLLARTEPAWVDAMHPEVMARPVTQLLESRALDTATVVCGCGGGAMRDTLPPLLHRAPRLVLDADALNTVAGEPALQKALRARGARQMATVLTPHPLEAARLLGTDTQHVQADRLHAARALADAMSCTVLLKGSGSVVATAGRTTSINPTGDARLGSAGSGDVLAGWLGGWWATGAQATTAHDIAQGTAWLHGAAVAHAARAGPLRASQLIEAMTLARDDIAPAPH
ncbi:MAG: NAD(P)H-hydrate dehydratase [Burkholderiaceae bacterium]|nr:NAD(P)H-hydrate dehydratase [Burkholderiaceae bacterium]